MSYVEPAAVLSPRASIRSVEVLYSTNNGGWSVARIGWENTQSVGIRWNGSEDAPGIGSPQSRGNPTWFILPEELHDVILGRVEELIVSAPGGLFDQYREMANDAQHEREAEDWSEGLIGDASAEG
ncbi:MAG: hypothetical protein WA474_01140 [Candidatus Sulfotelmatobacter sp.]